MVIPKEVRHSIIADFKYVVSCYEFLRSSLFVNKAIVATFHCWDCRFSSTWLTEKAFHAAKRQSPLLSITIYWTQGGVYSTYVFSEYVCSTISFLPLCKMPNMDPQIQMPNMDPLPHTQKWPKIKSRLQVVRSWELWKGHMKEVEGHFGTAVVSYFIFLRWLFLMNIVIFALWFGLVVIPNIAYISCEWSPIVPCKNRSLLPCPFPCIVNSACTGTYMQKKP